MWSIGNESVCPRCGDRRRLEVLEVGLSVQLWSQGAPSSGCNLLGLKVKGEEGAAIAAGSISIWLRWPVEFTCVVRRLRVTSAGYRRLGRRDGGVGWLGLGAPQFEQQQSYCGILSDTLADCLAILLSLV